PSTLGPRSETRLNDAATALGGLQFLVRERDPGYFVAFSYTYSAVFHDAAQIGGVTIGGPSKVRGNLFRLDVRRPIPRTRIAVSGSYTYDVSSEATTVAPATYLVLRPFRARAAKFYGGLILGFVSVVGGVF